MNKWIAVLLLVTVNHLMAQEVDSKRMERDLRISEDVIASLVKSEADEGDFFGVKVKSNYVPGFGLMINLNRGGSFSLESFNSDFDFHWEMNDSEWEFKIAEVQAMAEQIAAEAEVHAREAEMIARENEYVMKLHEEEMKEREEEKKELEEEIKYLEEELGRKGLSEEEKQELRREIRDHQRAIHRDMDKDVDVRVRTMVAPPEPPEVIVVRNSTRKSSQEDEDKYHDLFHRVSELYFSDYARLFGQLKDSDKIMLTTKIHPTDEDESGLKLSAHVLMSDIKALDAGKISRDNFIKKIVFSEAEIENEKPADLELLASIFQRLYKSDLATTYYTSNKITYERLEHYGVVYKMKMYSSIQYSHDNYKIVTQGKSGLTEAERNKIVDEMYPQFEQELKANMLDYGKTVKSLNVGESLMVQVKLTQCIDCKMPSSLEASIPFDILQDYNDGKLSRENALKKINISTKS